ncbi:hypothetical protein MT418_003226 [Batrachochytrium dendrobatidis]
MTSMHYIVPTESWASNGLDSSSDSIKTSVSTATFPQSTQETPCKPLCSSQNISSNTATTGMTIAKVQTLVADATSITAICPAKESQLTLQSQYPYSLEQSKISLSNTCNPRSASSASSLSATLSSGACDEEAFPAPTVFAARLSYSAVAATGHAHRIPHAMAIPSVHYGAHQLAVTTPCESSLSPSILPHTASFSPPKTIGLSTSPTHGESDLDLQIQSCMSNLGHTNPVELEIQSYASDTTLPQSTENLALENDKYLNDGEYTTSCKSSSSHESDLQNETGLQSKQDDHLMEQHMESADGQLLDPQHMHMYSYIPPPPMGFSYGHIHPDYYYISPQFQQLPGDASANSPSPSHAELEVANSITASASPSTVVNDLEPLGSPSEIQSPTTSVITASHSYPMNSQFQNYSQFQQYKSVPVHPYYPSHQHPIYYPGYAPHGIYANQGGIPMSAPSSSSCTYPAAGNGSGGRYMLLAQYQQPFSSTNYNGLQPIADPTMTHPAALSSNFFNQTQVAFDSTSNTANTGDTVEGQKKLHSYGENQPYHSRPFQQGKKANYFAPGQSKSYHQNQQQTYPHPSNQRARSTSISSNASTATSGHSKRQYGNSSSRGQNQQQYHHASNNMRAQERKNSFGGSDNGHNFYMTTNIYVRKLSPHVTDADFVELCKEFGKIVSSKAIIDPMTNMCKGFGFVMYETIEETQQATLGLVVKGYEVAPAKIGPRNMAVSPNQALPALDINTKELSADQETSLYVACLPQDMNEEGLLELFSDFKPISSRVMFENNVSRGMGFIKFSDRQAAKSAITKFNGAVIPGASRALRVSVAEPPGQRRHKNSHYKHHYMSRNQHYNLQSANSAKPLYFHAPQQVPWTPNPYSPQAFGQTGMYAPYYGMYSYPELPIMYGDVNGYPDTVKTGIDVSENTANTPQLYSTNSYDTEFHSAKCSTGDSDDHSTRDGYTLTKEFTHTGTDSSSDVVVLMDGKVYTDNGHEYSCNQNGFEDNVSDVTEREYVLDSNGLNDDMVECVGKALEKQCVV